MNDRGQVRCRVDAVHRRREERTLTSRAGLCLLLLVACKSKDTAATAGSAGSAAPAPAVVADATATPVVIDEAPEKLAEHWLTALANDDRASIEQRTKLPLSQLDFADENQKPCLATANDAAELRQMIDCFRRNTRTTEALVAYQKEPTHDGVRIVLDPTTALGSMLQNAAGEPLGFFDRDLIELLDRTKRDHLVFASLPVRESSEVFLLSITGGRVTSVFNPEPTGLGTGRVRRGSPSR